MPTLIDLVGAVQQYGAVLLLAGIALLVLLATVRRFWNTQGHDNQLAADTASQYKQLVDTLQDSLRQERNRSDAATKAYRDAIETGLTRRLDHCEEQHKNAEARLTQAHQRLNEERRNREQLEAELRAFRQAMAKAALISGDWLPTEQKPPP